MPEVENTITPPNWLNQQFIEENLRKSFKDSCLTVTECFIKPAVAVGDNYASQMFRVSLNLTKNGNKKSEKMSVIIKTLPTSNIMQEFIHEANVFGIETRMFVETLPSMQKLLDDVAPGKYPKLYAETYYHQGPPNDLIMLEDLCESGFRLADRFNGLDLDHTLFVLNCLGRLHASSYVLVKKNPAVIQQYQDAMFRPENEHMFGKMLKGGVVALAEEAETWPDFPIKYSEKLKAMENVIIDKCFESYKRDDTKLNVILHGDTWISNMMFKYEDNKVAEMKFVDYQLANYNSPALDVNYFIFTSPKQEIRENELDLLLKTYHESFINTLNLLNCTIQYSFDEFKEEFYNRLMFGFVSSILVFPITCAPREDAADINDLLDSSSTEFKNKQVFRSDYFKYVMKRIIPFFEKHGVF